MVRSRNLVTRALSSSFMSCMASNFFRRSLSLIATVSSLSKASLDTPKASAIFLRASAGGMLLPSSQRERLLLFTRDFLQAMTNDYKKLLKIKLVLNVTYVIICFYYVNKVYLKQQLYLQLYNLVSSAEVLEENNFYPFGLKHEGYNVRAGNPSYNYQYNGKELQE